MADISDLAKLNQLSQHGGFHDVSTEDLERYSMALCLPGASGHFSGNYCEICETVRLLLTQRYLSTLLNNLSRQSEKTAQAANDFAATTTRLTWVIAIFTAVLLLVTIFDVPRIPLKWPAKTLQSNQNPNLTTQQDR